MFDQYVAYSDLGNPWVISLTHKNKGKQLEYATGEIDSEELAEPSHCTNNQVIKQTTTTSREGV